jgi:hypothetical protein
MPAPPSFQLFDDSLLGDSSVASLPTRTPSDRSHRACWRTFFCYPGRLHRVTVTAYSSELREDPRRAAEAASAWRRTTTGRYSCFFRCRFEEDRRCSIWIRA